ncbi:hypothetical protein [Corynebacterium striatum]|uniref:hypothetical protein n=1 Tax=Corynebacterium striatum TaxID=43770 RepID=UPI003AE0851D
MARTQTTWMCVAKLGERFNPQKMVILSEHPTLMQAKKTAPLHEYRGVENVHLVRKETTYTPMGYKDANQ